MRNAASEILPLRLLLLLLVPIRRTVAGWYPVATYSQFSAVSQLSAFVMHATGKGPALLHTSTHVAPSAVGLASSHPSFCSLAQADAQLGVFGSGAGVGVEHQMSIVELSMTSAFIKP